MKKISALFALFGLAFIGTASAADITVYYSPTCPHCHHARDFISNNLIYFLVPFLDDINILLLNS